MTENKREGREFHLGDILSITGDALVSPRLIDGVYDILDYMTGDSNFTHQLPRAARECRPYLLMEMPWLEEIKEPADGWESEAAVWAWLDKQVKRYGEYHMVYPIHPEDHERIDPVEELTQMKGKDANVIVVEIEEEEPINPCGDINWKIDDEGEND